MIGFLDLQLFNDGGDGDGATVGDSGAVGPAEKVALDGNGQVRIIHEESGTVAGGEEEGTRGDGDEQAFYSPEEIRNTDFGKLDPAKIPQEMLPWYKSMQAGFTRKTQELAAERRAVQEALEQARGTPAAVAENPDRAFVQQVTDVARGQVEQLFNEEFDEFNPVHQAAMMLTVQQLFAEAAAAAGRKEALLGLEAELKAQEPRYGEIYEFAKARVTELPHREYVRLQEAFASGDVRTLRSFFEGARRDYYAARHGGRRGEAGLPVPRLESAGGGGSAGKEPLNYAELGRLKNFDDKLAWLRRHNIKP